MYSNQYFYPYSITQPETNRTPPTDIQLVNDIQKAINGEYSAIACYKQLAKMAPAQTERDQILEIRKDEKRHLEMFTNIYTQLTGRKPTPKIAEKCPNIYKEGLLFAFRDEQETVDFYLELSDKAQNTFIKESFRRAAADEQNHAVWFLFFLQRNRRQLY